MTASIVRWEKETCILTEKEEINSPFSDDIIVHIENSIKNFLKVKIKKGKKILEPRSTQKSNSYLYANKQMETEIKRCNKEYNLKGQGNRLTSKEIFSLR